MNFLNSGHLSDITADSKPYYYISSLYDCWKSRGVEFVYSCCTHFHHLATLTA